MTKQEQIEEMAKIVDEMYNVYTTTADDIADGLYNAGYRNTFTSDLANDTQKAYKEGYEKAQSELKTEIERLRTTLRQCNTELNSALESLKSQCREIGELKAENETYCKQITQAYDTGYDDGYDSCQDDIKQAKIDVLNKLKAKSYVNDYCREVVEIDKIDELLKEYE